MTSFEHLWAILETHAIPNKKADAARLWDTFTTDEQRLIYCTIRDKLQQGRFVHFNPVVAIKENAPRKSNKRQYLSANDYYQKYQTTEEQDGYKRVFLPDLQKTIYQKQ